MTKTNKITHEAAYDQDVKTMSYEELMDTIRFLDHEREEIKKSVQQPRNDDSPFKKIIKRAA